MTKTAASSFEAALLELEAIVASLEAANVPLETALEAYQKGASLVRECQDTLTAAEVRVQILEQNLLREFGDVQDLPRGDSK
jgi:exodeoxyribonuclease VII small subunit